MHPQYDQILKPGTYIAIITDFSVLDDHLMANLVTDGGVALSLGMGKHYGVNIHDYMDFTNLKHPRALRKRHHKAKNPPNRGPVGRNPW